MTDTRAIAEYIDNEVCCRVAAGDHLGEVKGVSDVLLAALRSVEIRDRTVLDVGCGVGGLGVELLRRGAAHVTGLDLSTQAIAEARRWSSRYGLDDKTTFVVADGAEAELAPADLMVLDKVYCCYFDPSGLLANTLPAARSVYALVLPASGGLRGLLSKLTTRVENLWHLVRRRGFRAHVHDVRQLDAAIQDAGFRLVVGRHHWLWDVRIYERGV